MPAKAKARYGAEDEQKQKGKQHLWAEETGIRTLAANHYGIQETNLLNVAP
jgi:hypothetical protein